MVRDEISAQIPKRKADIEGLESELATARAEQKHLAKAIALADDVPELVTELRQRSARIQILEAQVIAAKRTPTELINLIDKIETIVRGNLRALRASLDHPTDLREVFGAMFPTGLTFAASRTPDGQRQIWEIEGHASFARLATLGFRSNDDPGHGGDGKPTRARKSSKTDEQRVVDSEQDARFRMNCDPDVATLARDSDHSFRAVSSVPGCARRRGHPSETLTMFGDTLPTCPILCAAIGLGP